MLLSHVAPNLQRLLLLMSLIMAAKALPSGSAGRVCTSGYFSLRCFVSSLVWRAGRSDDYKEIFYSGDPWYRFLLHGHRDSALQPFLPFIHGRIYGE